MRHQRTCLANAFGLVNLLRAAPTLTFPAGLLGNGATGERQRSISVVEDEYLSVGSEFDSYGITTTARKDRRPSALTFAATQVSRHYVTSRNTDPSQHGVERATGLTHSTALECGQDYAYGLSPGIRLSQFRVAARLTNGEQARGQAHSQTAQFKSVPMRVRKSALTP